MGSEIGSPCLVFCGLSALKVCLDIEVSHQDMYLLGYFTVPYSTFLRNQKQTFHLHIKGSHNSVTRNTIELMLSKLIVYQLFFLCLP